MGNLRKMEMADIDAVVDLIDSHDADDAKEAEEGYRKGGVEDQLVLELDGRVIGVTGFNTPPGCDRTYWISWTYVHSDFCGRGYGRQMLTELMDGLRSQGARKLFVKISDYEDPDDGKIYLPALNLYRSLGFELEITCNDFYDEGEAQMILGCRIEPQDDSDAPTTLDEQNPIKFNQLFEIAETDGAYSFGWEVKGKKQFTPADLQLGIDAARAEGARAIFLTFPSNLPTIRDPLRKAGFDLIGKLSDYYESGVDELHFMYRL